MQPVELIDDNPGFSRAYLWRQDLLRNELHRPLTSLTAIRYLLAGLKIER
jgi:hypothetical protein